MLFEADYAKNYASIMYQCLLIVWYSEKEKRKCLVIGALMGDYCKVRCLHREESERRVTEGRQRELNV